MKNNNRARWLMAVASILAVGLILGGCGKKTTGPQNITPEVAVVTIQPKRVVITTELAGRTSANLVAEARPQVGGIIQKRLFAEGSDVKAGDVLYIPPGEKHQTINRSAKDFRYLEFYTCPPIGADFVEVK